MSTKRRKLKLPTLAEKNAEKGVEDHSLGYLRRRRPCYDGASFNFEMADYDLVEEQGCLGQAG